MRGSRASLPQPPTAKKSISMHRLSSICSLYDHRESCAIRSHYRPYPQAWKFSAEHLEVRLGFATANRYDNELV
jgi:hypothetical protein